MNPSTQQPAGSKPTYPNPNAKPPIPGVNSLEYKLRLKILENLIKVE
jgi:hypothetical protein